MRVWELLKYGFRPFEFGYHLPRVRVWELSLGFVRISDELSSPARARMGTNPNVRFSDF